MIEKCKRILFICGAITFDENYLDKFYDAETKLTSLGFTVFNPAMLPENLELEKQVSVTYAMVDASDEVVLFDDWVYSSRGKRQVRYAIEKCKPMVRYEEIIKGKGI